MTYFASGLRHQQDVIRLADTKANILLALIGVILSIFFSQVVSSLTLSPTQVTLVLLPFIISGIFGLGALFPRKGKNAKTNKSIFYFQAAKNIDIKRISSDISGDKAIEKIKSDYLENIKALSTIVEKKVSYLRSAYLFLALAVFIKLFFEITVWIS